MTFASRNIFFAGLQVQQFYTMNFQFNLKILLKSFFLFLFENNKILPQIANQNYSYRQNSRPGETDPYDPQDFSHFLISEKMSLSAVQTEDYIEEYDSGVSTGSRTSTPDKLENNDGALVIELREETVRLRAQIEILLRIILTKESPSSSGSESASGVSRSTQTDELNIKLFTTPTQITEVKTSNFIKKKLCNQNLLESSKPKQTSSHLNAPDIGQTRAGNHNQPAHDYDNYEIPSHSYHFKNYDYDCVDAHNADLQNIKPQSRKHGRQAYLSTLGKWRNKPVDVLTSPSSETIGLASSHLTSIIPLSLDETSIQDDHTEYMEKDSTPLPNLFERNLIKTPFFPSPGITFFQFWKKAKADMKMKQIRSSLQAIYIKMHLKGEAKMISRSFETLEELEKMLMVKYGNEVQILRNITKKHQEIGEIPPILATKKKQAMKEAFRAKKIAVKHLKLISQAESVIDNIGWKHIRRSNGSYLPALINISSTYDSGRKIEMIEKMMEKPSSNKEIYVSAKERILALFQHALKTNEYK